MKWVLGLALACLSVAPALDAAPLTLEQALAAVDQTHPELELVQAGQALAEAERDLADARLDWNVTLEAGLRRVRPAVGSLPEQDDHLARLSARKTLSDFGRSEAWQRAAAGEVDGMRFELASARDRRRLDIMTRFFAVVLADRQFTVDNERMAVAYVAFDQARDRQQRGLLSPVDLAAAELRYQNALLRRNASQAQMRLRRAALAQTLNRPGQLPDELAEPVLTPALQAAPPEYEALRERLAHNVRLRAAGRQLEASHERLEAVRREQAPTLDVDLEAATYARELSGRDAWRAGVILTWPLHQGGRVDARAARALAEFQRAQAQVARLRLELDQTLLELTLEIEQLHKTALQAAAKRNAYQDLALEQARGYYEQELKANLGDAMAASLEAQLEARRVEFQLALAWAQLEALLGLSQAEIRQHTAKEGP